MAIHQYSLSDLLANNDISHYKYDNSYYYTNLIQYKDTDWNLLLLAGTSGDSNNAFRSQSGLDVYNTGTLTGSEQYYNYKFNRFVHITKIECDIQMPSYLGQTGMLWLGGIKEDGNNWVRVDNPDATWNFWVEKGTNSYNAMEHWTSNDTSWHHMSVDLDVETEYLCAMVYHVPVNIKNMVITAEDRLTSNGGGATHIAKRTGQLSTLSSYTSDILIVSGGGGGGTITGASVLNGKDAGGISGSGDNSANQTTGNAFGLGESSYSNSAGGSGLYGGYKGTSSKSGGAGSGYIGNSLLSNKKMVGYNVPTSSAEGTKTESVNTYESTHIANKPKSGNGWARIKLKSEELVLYDNGYVNEQYIDIDNPIFEYPFGYESYCEYLKESQYLQIYTYSLEGKTTALNVKYRLNVPSGKYKKCQIEFYLKCEQSGFYTFQLTRLWEDDKSMVSNFKNGIYNNTLGDNTVVVGNPDTEHTAINDYDNLVYVRDIPNDEYLWIQVRSTNRNCKTTLRIKKISFWT